MAPSRILGFSQVRLVIADEEAAFRENLRKALRAQQGIEIVGEAHDRDSAVALMARLSPQVLLLDYALCPIMPPPGPHGQGSGLPTVRTIVMLTAPDKAKIIESFRLGAQGIVLRGSARRVWWRSISAVMAGQYWLGNESLAALIQAIRESSSHSSGAWPAQYYGLTPREIEIVQKVADGRSNKEVGQDFSIREGTVKHHLTNIFGKVGVSSRLELALFARDRQIFTVPASSDFTPAGELQDDRLQADERQTDAAPKNPEPKSHRSEPAGQNMSEGDPNGASSIGRPF